MKEEEGVALVSESESEWFYSLESQPIAKANGRILSKSIMIRPPVCTGCIRMYHDHFSLNPWTRVPTR